MTEQDPNHEQPQEQEPIPKEKFRRLKLVYSHFRSEWYKYVIQAAVVFCGVIIAFSLEKLHLYQIAEEEFDDAYELIAQEL